MLIVLYLISIPARKPHLDDAWLAEHSYWLVKQGVAQSKLMTGIADGEDRLILHHKLFTLQGAVVMTVFGFSLQWFKSVSLLYLLLTIALFYFVRNVQQLFSNKTAAAIAAFLLWLHPLVFEYSFVFRPETMLMFLGFVSFLLLLKTIASEQAKLSVWLSGLIAGLAFATHLNGSVIIAAGFLVLIFNKQFKYSVLFALGATAAASIYFYDFKSFADFGLWYRQLTFIPSGDESSAGFFAKFFLNFIEEHRRYFHSPKEMAFTVLLLFMLIKGMREQKKTKRFLFNYTFWLALSMSIIALNKTSKYLIVLLPYFSMIIANAMVDRRLIIKKWDRYFAFGFLGIYLITALFYNTKLSSEKYHPALNRFMTRELTGSQSKDLTVMAPMMFVFDEMNQYKKIISLMSINERLKLNPALKGTELLHQLNAEQIDLLLLNKTYIEKFAFSSFKQGDQYQGFTMVYYQADLMVWKRTTTGAVSYSGFLPTYVNRGLLHFGSAFSY